MEPLNDESSLSSLGTVETKPDINWNVEIDRCIESKNIEALLKLLSDFMKGYSTNPTAVQFEQYQRLKVCFAQQVLDNDTSVEVSSVGQLLYNKEENLQMHSNDPNHLRAPITFMMHILPGVVG